MRESCTAKQPRRLTRIKRGQLRVGGMRVGLWRLVAGWRALDENQAATAGDFQNRCHRSRSHVMHRTLLFLAIVASSPIAHAAVDHPWTLRVGGHVVDPKSSSGTLASGTLKADVDSDWRPTFSLEYMFTPNIGIDVLAALPFSHEVRLNGAKAADVKQLPPTVSLNWHFNPDGTVNPFVGLGLNYTRFFSIDESGPLEGARLTLDDSFGLAAHVGVDFALSSRWAVTVDARWMDIDSKVKVDGAGVGTVNIDPIALGVSAAYRF
jgi:outer membrane protein